MGNKTKYLDLPKKKEIDGKEYPYISYSQYSSFNETNEEFKNQMILKYIFGIEVPSRYQIFADFGTHCGEYIETDGKKRGELLSDADCKILDNLKKGFSINSEYEREVWIDRGNYFILGFIDRWEPLKETYKDPNNTGLNTTKILECNVEDFKTGNVAKKKSFYASSKYGQTTLYSESEILKGNKITESFVTLLGRKGNPLSEDNPTKLGLTGEVIKIPTPYTKERAKNLLLDMDRTAKDLALLKQTHEKLKELKIEL